MNYRFLTLPVLALSGAAFSQTIPSSIISPFTSAADEAVRIRSVYGIAEMRRGNNSGTGGDWEVGAYPGGSATNPGSQIRQYTWGTSNHAFTLQYTASTRQISLSVGGTPVTATSTVDKAPDAIWIRVRGSADGVGSVSGVKLAMSGNAARSLSNDSVTGAFGGVSARAIEILNIDSSMDWTLTGTVALSAGNGSNTAVQIKMGEPVPEPASMAALAAGLGLIARRRRNRAK